MGFKRLRSRDFYFDDPLLKRFCGLNSIPDVSTISRSLSLSDQRSLELLGDLNEKIVLDRIKIEKLKTVTLDFDGFVVSTGGKVEDSAAGFNKSKKGARSYYPLGCTVAQTSQVLGLLHRSGNVHDSNQAEQFILERVRSTRSILSSQARIESRLDSAFFNSDLVYTLDDENVEFSVSMPFCRFAHLKELVESRKRWIKIDETWSYFEINWSPESWLLTLGPLFLGKTKNSTKGPSPIRPI